MYVPQLTSVRMYSKRGLRICTSSIHPTNPAPCVVYPTRQDLGAWSLRCQILRVPLFQQRNLLRFVNSRRSHLDFRRLDASPCQRIHRPSIGNAWFTRPRIQSRRRLPGEGDSATPLQDIHCYNQVGGLVLLQVYEGGKGRFLSPLWCCAPSISWMRRLVI